MRVHACLLARPPGWSTWAGVSASGGWCGNAVAAASRCAPLMALDRIAPAALLSARPGAPDHGNAANPLLPRAVAHAEFHARGGGVQRVAARADARGAGARGRAGRRDDPTGAG